MHASRRYIYYLNRALICVVGLLAIGSLLIPVNSLPHLAFDILIRTYLIFLGTVMAHESVHGHLGRTRRANFWWGRIALLPSMVPFTNFRRTHQLHHTFTNIPDKDPDHFMKSRNLLELSLRAIAMPHHWFFWLRRRGRLKRADLIELWLNYAGIFTLYAAILAFVGPTRLFWGMTPPLILVSLLLWYPFAVQTHEGFSTGTAEARSHNYYGRFMYWFSLGLSMHREHHLQPKLSWIELRPYVQAAPHGRWWWPQRDIRPDAAVHKQSLNCFDLNSEGVRKLQPRVSPSGNIVRSTTQPRWSWRTLTEFRGGGELRSSQGINPGLRPCERLRRAFCPKHLDARKS